MGRRPELWRTRAKLQSRAYSRPRWGRDGRHEAARSSISSVRNALENVNILVDEAANCLRWWRQPGRRYAAAPILIPIEDTRKEKPAPNTRPLAADRRLIFADVGCLSRVSFAVIGRLKVTIEGLIEAVSIWFHPAQY